MITKEHFLNKYNISNDLFESSGMTWDDLCYIYKDFSDKHDKYDNIRKNFIQEYLDDIGKKSKEKVNIHSVCSRVKDPEHLIAKIIRKKQEKQSKYKNLDKTNYEKFITDLIGIRCLVLFKADWQSFHRYI